MTSEGVGKGGLGPPRLRDFDYSRSDVAYFVTICADSGSPFTNPVIAAIVLAGLEWLRRERGVLIHAYCLMPDHLHPLLHLPNLPVVAPVSPHQV